jgi:hypothetical protein
VSRDEPLGQRPTFRTLWFVSFLAFVCLGSIWSLGQPLFSGADEIEHFKKAQAVVTGQYTQGRTSPGTSWDWTSPTLRFRSLPAQTLAGEVNVHVPTAQGFFCFIATPSVGAACDKTTLSSSWPATRTLTYEAHQPLPAYLLSGGPVVLDPRPTGLYWSRFLTSVVGAAFLATSVALAFSRRRPFLLVGILVAATPAMIAGLGVLSSSPLEIGSAGLLWTTMALLVDGEPPTARFVALMAAAASILAVARPVSFLWVGVAGLALLILLRPEKLKALVRLRSVRIGGAATLLAVVAGVAWYKVYGARPDPLYLPGLHLAYPIDISGRLSASLSPMKSYWLEAIGSLGYPDTVKAYALDYSGPWLVQLGWTAMIALVVGAGALFAGRRRRLTLGVLIVILLALPILINYIYLPRTGYFWQGRYDLPLLGGIIILGAAQVDKVRARLPELRRTAMGAVVLCGALEMVEFVGGLRRFTVGINGSLSPFDWGSGWHPPAPALSLLALMAVALLGTYGWLALQVGRVYGSRPTEDPTSEGRPSVSQSVGS